MRAGSVAFEGNRDVMQSFWRSLYNYLTSNICDSLVRLGHESELSEGASVYSTRKNVPGDGVCAGLAGRRVTQMTSPFTEGTRKKSTTAPRGIRRNVS